MAKNGKKAPKYHSLLPLLQRKSGATMDELMKAIRASNSHDVQNTLVSVRQAGYSWNRAVGKDELARWFVKAPQRKARTPVKAKTTEKPAPKKIKAKSKKSATTRPTPKAADTSNEHAAQN